jgi:hypothetical protein
MDADELATPGYAVLSPATRTKLATLDKGQLMVRHPHFTQPIFVRFPRPAVLRGRDGAERWPQAADVGLEAALVRSLRGLDSTLTVQWAQEYTALYDAERVLAARNAAVRERVTDVRRYFQAHFRTVLSAQPAPARPATAPIRVAPADDPYGF